MLRKTRPMNNSSGSVLVGAIALSVLMAIAGIGFLQVTAISVNSETTALINEKALQAAESGIWVGARWLRGDLAFPTLAADNPDILLMGSPISINGLDVYVTIPVTVVGADNIPVATIIANVYKGGSTPGPATFKKRITYGDVRCRVFGEYGTFYDGYQSTNANDFPGNWNTGATWNGWGDRTFNGRFHMNSLTNKLLNNTPRFNGLVTVAKIAGQTSSGYGIGHDSNNYNYGVWGYGASGAPTVAELDQIFPGQYIPNVDQINLNITRTDAASIAGDASIPAADRITLPTSNRDDGYGPYQYRPMLYFDGANAHYEYRDATGYHSQIYGPAGIGGTINNKIFLSNNNLNVYSTGAHATGRFTVATATGRSIVPVGNLVTSDYNVATGQITNPDSPNMIGLISGGYIAFNKTWTKRFATDGADANKYVSEQVDGGGPGAPPGQSGNVGTLHMSAAIIAVENFNDVLRNGTGNNTQAYNMKGCEWWDGMWMQQTANGAFTNANNRCEDYGFKLFGNHILGGYSRTIWADASGNPDPTRGCNGNLVFTHDPRMYQRFLQPPAFPSVVSANGLLVLKMTKWAESNVY